MPIDKPMPDKNTAADDLLAWLDGDFGGPAIRPQPTELEQDLAEIEGCCQMTDGPVDALRRLLVQARNEIAKRHERAEVRKKKWKQAGDQVRRTQRGWSQRTEAELNGSRLEAHAARKARNARDHRRRLQESEEPTAPVAPPIAQASLASNDLSSRLASLSRWLEQPGHRQAKLRGRASGIVRSWITYQWCLKSLGRAPTLAEFAAAFSTHCHEPMTRPMARNRIALLVALEGEGGPWHDDSR